MSSGPPLLRVVSTPSPEPRALNEQTDDELMLLASAGRREAFAELVSRYLPRLVGFCGKFVGNAQLGRELAQEVLLQAWAQRQSYRPSGKFAPFLFTLARNLCRNRWRDASRHGRWLGESETGQVASAAQVPLEALLEAEQARRVHAAIAGLPEKLRDAVLLRFDQGLDYADVSQVLGCPEETARSRVFHGLKKLRAELAQENAA